MSDNPTTEVLRRAEESLAALRASSEQHEHNIMTWEARVAETQAALFSECAALTRDKEEIARWERVLEPLAGIKATEWTETAKAQPAQPWARPEKHKTRRTLAELLIEAVHNNPGRNHEELAQILTLQRRRHTDAEKIRELLHDLADDDKLGLGGAGWYPAPEPADASITLVQDHEECQRDAQALSGARTAPSGASPAEISPTPETAPQEPPGVMRHGSPEWSLDCMHRHGGWMSDFQLRSHVHNLADLLEQGRIEIRADGFARYVDRGETTEAAK